jgi:hypothetical protein
MRPRHAVQWGSPSLRRISPWLRERCSRATLLCVLATATACGGAVREAGLFAAPTAVVAAPTTTSGELLVSWGAVNGATAYRVHLSLTPGIATHIDALPGEIVVRGTTSTSLRFASLLAGGPYFVAVTAGDGATFGAYSAEAAGSRCRCRRPFVTVAGAGEVITSWAPVPGATGYEVTLAADASVNHTNFASLPEGQQFALTTTLQRFTGLTNGTTYWAVVRATNASGASSDTGGHHATPTARGTFLPRARSRSVTARRARSPRSSTPTPSSTSRSWTWTRTPSACSSATATARSCSTRRTRPMSAPSRSSRWTSTATGASSS